MCFSSYLSAEYSSDSVSLFCFLPEVAEVEDDLGRELDQPSSSVSTGEHSILA